MVKSFNGFNTLSDYLQSLIPSSPTGSLVYNTLTDLQNAYPNGTTQPAWIISDQAWYYWSGAIITDTTPPVITASVQGGTYTSSQTVTLSSNETATIYYTTNGSTPTTSSSVYSSPLNITSTITLKYFGKDTAGNSSSVVTQTYTINAVDTTPPVITASVQGGTYTSSQSVTLSCNESNTTIYYTLDGSTPTTSSTVYTSPLTINSTTTLEYIGKDASGNISSPVTQTYTINIDTTPPVITASPVGGTYTSAQTVTLSANETSTIYYTTDGSTPTTSSTVYSSPITISATTTLQYIGKDTAGNVSTPVATTYTINIPLSTYASDDFNRADSTTSMGSTDSYNGGSSYTWTPYNLGFGTSTWGISSNTAYTTTSGVGASVVNIGQSDIDMSVTVPTWGTVSGTSAVGLVFRVQDGNKNFWRLFNNGGTNLQLQKYVAGTATVVGTMTPTFTNGDTIRIIAKGSSLTVYFNGSQIGTYTDSQFSTATNHGIHAYSGANARFDNFIIKQPA